VGTVVTRSPNSNIASIAMRDFNVALALFEKTALQSQRAKIALVRCHLPFSFSSVYLPHKRAYC